MTNDDFDYVSISFEIGICHEGIATWQICRLMEAAKPPPKLFT